MALERDAEEANQLLGAVASLAMCKNECCGSGVEPKTWALGQPARRAQHTRNTPALSTRTRRDHTRSVPTQARNTGMGKAHLSTRMRRDHTRQGNRRIQTRRNPQPGVGGGGGGEPTHLTTTGVTYSHSISSDPVANVHRYPPGLARGSPGVVHPARRQRSAVSTGTRFVSLRENKQIL